MLSSSPGSDAYPLGEPARWPAADIAASWRRELPGVRAGAVEIITPLWRIAKILADDRRQTLAGLGIDGATLDLLSVIRRAGPPYELTTREIARRTLVTAGAVSQRVARAEEAGLVGRAPSAASRRAVAVRLTDAGHALIETAARPLLDHETDLVSVLTGDERRALTAVLAKLERALTGSAEPPDHADERDRHADRTSPGFPAPTRPGSPGQRPARPGHARENSL